MFVFMYSLVIRFVQISVSHGNECLFIELDYLCDGKMIVGRERRLILDF